MKISVDSATMVNKIFEIIEAHILFKIPISKIKIKIHKESMVHCAIVLNNGLVYLVAHDTSMTIPIRNSLFDNKFSNDKKNSFKNNLYFNYTFDEKNLNKYRILKTGLKIAKFGQAGWILFNVVNDMLVKKFLKKEIFFYQIEETLISVFSNKIILKYCQKKIKSIFAINNAIRYAKNILLK